MNNTAYSNNSKLQIQWAQDLMHSAHNILSKTTSLLDLGCGPGKITSMLCDHYSNITIVHGLDRSASQLEIATNNYCNKYPGLNFIEGDILNLNNLPQKYNVIFSTCVFHWVPDQKQVLMECYNNLNKNGHLLFCVPGYSSTNISIISNKLIKSPRWEDIFQTFENNRSYHSVSDYGIMADEMGYKINIIKSVETETEYDDVQAIKNWIKPISPYYEHIQDKNDKEEFLDEIINVLFENKIHQTNQGKYILKSYKIWGILQKI